MRCVNCKHRAIYSYGLTEAERPIPLCVTHAILLRMALHLEWWG